MNVQVKICGLSTADTMNAALANGADFVGLVFYPPSPRYVTPAKAAPLAAMARGRARIVALVVDANDALLKDIADAVKPDYFQLHGNETPERVSAIKALTGKPIIKAIRVGGPEDVSLATGFVDVADMILFDTKAPASLKNALPGGNGIPFDWSLLEGKRGFMLSGGLNPANVAEAIRVTGAPMVDVSSGVESAPGKKDSALIAKFIEAAKAAR
jgi:phosphoribosylanthranilate isomerase